MAGGAYPVKHGPSILEMLWEELDKEYAELKRGPLPLIKGRCAGLARAIAIMTNPYSPDEDAVRVEVERRRNS